MSVAAPPRTSVSTPKQPELFSDEWLQLMADAAWRKQRRQVLQSQNVWNRISIWSLPLYLCFLVIVWLIPPPDTDIIPPWDDPWFPALLSCLMLSVRLDYLARLESRLLTAIDQISQGSRELSAGLRFPVEWATWAREPDLRQNRLGELWERQDRLWRHFGWLWRCSTVVIILALLAVISRWIIAGFDTVFLARIGWIVIIYHAVLNLVGLLGWRIAAERTLLMSKDRFEAEGGFHV